MGDQPFEVPLSETFDAPRIGVVAQIRADTEPVVFDSADRTAWRPRMSQGTWAPFDKSLFETQAWRSCVALPIVSAGRIIGALSVYSSRPAREVVVNLDELHEASFWFFGPLLRRREEDTIQSLVDRYDAELMRSNVSLSALSLGHDILHYHKSLVTDLEQAALRLNGPNAHLAAESIAQAREILRRADPVIDAMRTLAREARSHDLREDDQESNPEEVAAAVIPVLKAILPLVSKRVEPSNIRLEVEGESFLTRITPTNLERVLLNLALNSAQWRATDIDVSVRFRDGRASVVVRDNGKGIPAEDRPRVFDRFVTGRKEGSGLGLYVVRSLVSAAGGEVFLQSVHQDEDASNHMTAVTVSLPRSGWA